MRVSSEVGGARVGLGPEGGGYGLSCREHVAFSRPARLSSLSLRADRSFRLALAADAGLRV